MDYINGSRLCVLGVGGYAYLLVDEPCDRCAI